MSERKIGRGGYRPGAGRKKRDCPIVSYSVDITHEQAELLKKWGGGDISAGLRWLVEVAELYIKELKRG